MGSAASLTFALGRMTICATMVAAAQAGCPPERGRPRPQQRRKTSRAPYHEPGWQVWAGASPPAPQTSRQAGRHSEATTALWIMGNRTCTGGIDGRQSAPNRQRSPSHASTNPVPNGP
jgi:hypothetical protein